MTTTMTLDDQRHLEAARGWLGLGDWQSANDELEEIAPALRADAEVLLLRVEIYLKAGNPTRTPRPAWPRPAAPCPAWLADKLLTKGRAKAAESKSAFRYCA